MPIIQEGVDEAELKILQNNPEIAEALVEVVGDDPTPEAVINLITNPSFDDLSGSEKAVIAESLSSADQETKKAFESVINVFEDEAYSSYVPSGSTVSVSTRRTVVAVVAATAAAAQAAAATTSRPRT